MILKADYEAKTIFEIEYDKLKDTGVKAIAFDLDSTVMKSKSGKFDENTLKLFEKLKKDFFIMIISNNSDMNYIENASQQIDFPIIGHAKKPQTSISKKFLRENNISINELVMVGDRPLTDILFGKMLGCKTVLVDSISWREEKPIVRIARRIERLVNI